MSQNYTVHCFVCFRDFTAVTQLAVAQTSERVISPATFPKAAALLRSWCPAPNSLIEPQPVWSAARWQEYGFVRMDIYKPSNGGEQRMHLQFKTGAALAFGPFSVLGNFRE